MKLIIDIGNTKTKIALFNSDKIVSTYSNTLNHILPKIQQLAESNTIYSCIISSVTTESTELIDYCKTQFNTIVLTSKTRIPIRNNYQSPMTLGNDRLACAVAINTMYKSQHSLSIDFGTCIKYDFVNLDSTYLGGAISPGLLMRYQALNTFTNQLPLLQPDELIDFIGNDTKSSLISGVQHGILAEVNGVIDSYIERFGKLNVIITGGDYKYFDKGLKNITFADPYIVLKGLNEILEFNTKN